MSTDNAQLWSRWRASVFAATWLSYAGYYFARKPFFVVKSKLVEDLDITTGTVSVLGTSYLVAYALGQFIAGWAGDRWGPRILVLTGMVVSVVCGLLSGFANSWQMVAAFLFVNGLAQATGWSGNVGAMAPWFRREERGTVMGFWATNFQVGGVVATAFAAWVLGEWGWRWSFFAGSLVLLAVTAFFAVFQRDKPEDVGLPALVDDPLPVDEALVDAVRDLSPEAREELASAVGAAPPAAGWSVDTWINVGVLGVFYFFVKFIRYAVWSWVPYLLYVSYGLKEDQAGYLSTVFDAAGVAGVVAFGLLSDRLFAGRRASLSLVFILAMAAACGALYAFGRSDLLVFTVAIGAIGFFLYGPDAIMTSAGAIDVGSGKKAVLAAGIINGMGSVGAVVQEVVLGQLLDGDDVGPVFATLLGSAVLAAACLCVLLLRNRSGRADV